jgi:hypothetical protein
VLYHGESHDDFQTFRGDIVADLDPQGAIERLFTEDVVHYQWEAVRHRRYLMKHISACEHEGVNGLLETMSIYDDVRQDLAARFALGAPDAVRRVKQLLAAAGHDLETARARAIALHLDEIGRYQGLIGAAEKRRDKALRELAAHRDRARGVKADAPSGNGE